MFQAVQKSKTLKYSENEIYQYYLGDKAVGKNSIGGSSRQKPNIILWHILSALLSF